MDMKKFSLKPLGDSCMKMLCKSCFFIGLLMTFCLTACSDEVSEQRYGRVCSIRNCWNANRNNHGY